ncbi:MAG: class I SAM-dependent methyltransferase [Peptococcaceae bacterium]|nr:class I SAM-dependent methyltransferase [Peptococcaceae bacterium]
MEHNASQQWSQIYTSSSGTEMAFPSEYVIRIFKGKYPRLDLDKASFRGKSICDLGCGDGRNMLLLSQCGFEVSGMEIAPEICQTVTRNLGNCNVNADVRVGTNDSVPFEECAFDFLLSWNACYYMGHNDDFNKHIDEFARVLKPNGLLVLSLPKKSCFIYKNCDIHKPGYAVIREDPFNVRQGEILRIFEGESEIETVFSRHFNNFVFASIHDDCFGFEYHWHLAVCRKSE